MSTYGRTVGKKWPAGFGKAPRPYLSLQPDHPGGDVGVDLFRERVVVVFFRGFVGFVVVVVVVRFIIAIRFINPHRELVYAPLEKRAHHGHERVRAFRGNDRGDGVFGRYAKSARLSNINTNTAEQRLFQRIRVSRRLGHRFGERRNPGRHRGVDPTP